MTPHPVIAPEIIAPRPDYTAPSLAVAGGTNRASDAASARLLAEAGRVLAHGLRVLAQRAVVTAAILDQAGPDGRPLALDT